MVSGSMPLTPTVAESWTQSPAGMVEVPVSLLYGHAVNGPLWLEEQRTVVVRDCSVHARAGEIMPSPKTIAAAPTSASLVVRLFPNMGVWVCSLDIWRLKPSFIVMKYGFIASGSRLGKKSSTTANEPTVTSSLFRIQQRGHNRIKAR